MGFNELNVWVFRLNCKKDIKSLCELGNLPSKEWSEEEKVARIFNIITSKKNTETYIEITNNKELDPEKEEDKKKILYNIRKKYAELISKQKMFHWQIENKEDMACEKDYTEVKFITDIIAYAEFRHNIYIYPVQIGPILFRVYVKNNQMYLFAFSKKDHIDIIGDFLKSILSCELDNVSIESKRLLYVEKKYAGKVLEASWDEVEYTYKAKIGKGDIVGSKYRAEFDRDYTRISSRFLPNDNITNINQELKSSKIGIYIRSTAGTLKVSATYKSGVNLKDLRDSITTFILSELL